MFDGPGRPLRIERVPLTDPQPGSILARVRMATLCGSDLHTFTGKRVEPTPIVLGHEITGEVAALGQGVRSSASGHPLAVGDRISFTIMASCGKCANCLTDLPQKCASLFKYGHAAFDDEPGLSGGLAEYVYLRPGTAVYHVPDGLSDEQVCPANCALATVLNGLEAVGMQAGDRVLVQGAGLLGLYATALTVARGASETVVTDVDDARLEIAGRFGAGRVVNVRGMDEDETVDALGRGAFDCGVEVCGNPAAVAPGVRSLALRGRYVIIGLVSAGSCFTIDGDTVARNYLTIKGVHNYAPRHLAEALAFLAKTRARFPYDALIGPAFPLAETQAAFEAALARAAVRVAVVPHDLRHPPRELRHPTCGTTV